MTGKSQTVEPLPGVKPEIGLSLSSTYRSTRLSIAVKSGRLASPPKLGQLLEALRLSM